LGVHQQAVIGKFCGSFGDKINPHDFPFSLCSPLLEDTHRGMRSRKLCADEGSGERQFICVSMPLDLDDDEPTPAPTEVFESLPAVLPAPKTGLAGRELPHSDEVEAHILGCMLNDPTSLDDGRAIDPDAFYSPANRLIFETALEIRKKTGTCDTAQLAEGLRSSRKLKIVGGMAYLVQVSNFTTTATFRPMVDRLRELFVLREIIRKGTAAVEGAYGVQQDVQEYARQVALEMESLGRNEARLLPRLPAGKLRITSRSDRSCLLGNRFLNRGDGAIIVASSGMGKSSMMLQMAVCWGLGRDFFGMKCNGALSSLIFQSEDSEGDVAEVWESVCYALKLTNTERAKAGEMVQIVTDRIHSGAGFINEAAGHIRQMKPDLVWINPLAAFVGGDISDAQEAGNFLRGHLNGLNAACDFGWMIVTHTTKPPTDKGKTETKWSEVMYDMAGSYDLIGWARAIMSLRATPVSGEFDLVLAKRGSRAEVMIEVESESGLPKYERTLSIPMKHSSDKFRPPGSEEEIPLVVWEGRKAEDKEKPGRPRTHNFSDYAPIFPKVAEKAVGVRILHRMAKEIRAIGAAAFERIVDEAVDDGTLVKDATNVLQPKYYLNAGPK
jgi:hypothetical protein